MALALALSLGAWLPARAQTPDATVPTVTVARVGRACLTDLVFFNGTLVPREEILIVPEVEGGRVSEIRVDEGDRVTAGQVLARLVRGQADVPGQSETLDVKAPADGMILRRGARLGAMTSPASPEPLFRMSRGDEIEVEADIPELRMTRLAEGQPARIQVPGAGEATGRVRKIAPEIDRQTRLGRVRIAVEGGARLRPGSTVSGSIETSRSCGLTVPVSALLTRGAGTVVQRVRDGRVETRPVRLGLVEGARAEVQEGLSEGDEVVARAGAFLRDGDAVRPVPEAAPTTTGELRQ